MEQNRETRRGDRRGLRVGSALGVPIYVSPTWLIIAAVIIVGYQPRVHTALPGLSETGQYLTAGAFVLLLFASVLLHELGHAVTALHLGVRVRSMTLWMLGGYTEMESEPSTPGGEFAVAVAGPVVSAALAVAGMAGLLVVPGGVAHQLAVQVMLANLSVAVFNILPGLPLDGGSLVRAAVWRLGGDRGRGTIVAGWGGRLVAAIVLLSGLALALSGRGAASTDLLITMGVGVFLWVGATQSIRTAQLTARMPELDARLLVRPSLVVHADLPLAEAMRRATEAGARGLVVTDGNGAATAVVSEHAVAATPVERRPWVSVAAVARTLEPGMIIPADLTGEDLLRAMRACPSAEYVVNDGDRVLGVLVAGDVVHTLDPKGTIR